MFTELEHAVGVVQQHIGVKNKEPGLLGGRFFARHANLSIQGRGCLEV